jgi:hypothetical protein
MSMMMRVTKIRGGRRVRCWRRRPQIREVFQATIVPTEPVASAVGAQVARLEDDVRDDLRQAPAELRTRRMRRLARRLVDCAISWWNRIAWTPRCQAGWLLRAVRQVRHCSDLWQRLRIGLLLRKVRRKRWYAEWRMEVRTPRCDEGRRTSPCT